MLHLPSGPAASGGVSEDEVARMIAARMRRQAILYELGREIALIMGEAPCGRGSRRRPRWWPSWSTSPGSPNR